MIDSDSDTKISACSLDIFSLANTTTTVEEYPYVQIQDKTIYYKKQYQLCIQRSYNKTILANVAPQEQGHEENITCKVKVEFLTKNQTLTKFKANNYHCRQRIIVKPSISISINSSTWPQVEQKPQDMCFQPKVIFIQVSALSRQLPGSSRWLLGS